MRPIIFHFLLVNILNLVGSRLIVGGYDSDF